MGKALRTGLIVVALFAACSSDDSPPRAAAGSGTAAPQSPAPSNSSSRPTVSIPAELMGTFATLIASADVPRADEAGSWALTLSNDGTYRFGRFPTDTRANTGKLTVAGDALRFSDEEGEGACPGPGTYTWSRAGDSLTFTLVDDACLVRKIQSTTQPYLPCSAGPETCVKSS